MHRKAACVCTEKACEKTAALPKIPHGPFLYVKQQARGFLVNADHSRKINTQLFQFQSFITTFFSYLFLPQVIILIMIMISYMHSWS